MGDSRFPEEKTHMARQQSDIFKMLKEKKHFKVNFYAK